MPARGRARAPCRRRHPEAVASDTDVRGRWRRRVRRRGRSILGGGRTERCSHREASKSESRTGESVALAFLFIPLLVSFLGERGYGEKKGRRERQTQKACERERKTESVDDFGRERGRGSGIVKAASRLSLVTQSANTVNDVVVCARGLLCMREPVCKHAGVAARACASENVCCMLPRIRVAKIIAYACAYIRVRACVRVCVCACACVCTRAP
eukprot:1660802-Pleurochrysis_carterae.AAC.2